MGRTFQNMNFKTISAQNGRGSHGQYANPLAVAADLAFFIKYSISVSTCVPVLQVGSTYLQLYNWSNGCKTGRNFVKRRGIGQVASLVGKPWWRQ